MKTLVLSLCLMLVSCESIRFYSQAIGGQLGIISKRRDIQALVDDPATDAGLRSRLEVILAIRRFAEAELALPVDNNFSTYVDLERPFVVWNVFATPEFSLQPEQWCYPVAGCVTYRGYFSEASARRFAGKLRDEGKDVFVGGVAAYSTLGWFADPVLNTVINQDGSRLASLVFHELAHQVVYLPGDTEFNEGFATAVELEGLGRWLNANTNSREAAELVARAEWEKEHRREFVALVQGIVPPLQALYASDLPAQEMRKAKARLIDGMRADYRELKQNWQNDDNDDDSFDGWFATDINNAKITSVSTYFNRVPAFEALLAETGHDLPAFYDRVKTLGRLPKAERDAALDALSVRAGGPVLESATNTRKTDQESLQ